MADSHRLTLKAGRTQEYLSVIGLLLFTTVWRFYQVRTLALPAWVDSVHMVLVQWYWRAYNTWVVTALWVASAILPAARLWRATLSTAPGKNQLTLFRRP